MRIGIVGSRTGKEKDNGKMNFEFLTWLDLFKLTLNSKVFSRKRTEVYPKYDGNVPTNLFNIFACHKRDQNQSLLV